MKVIKKLLVVMLMGIMVAGQIELCGMGTKKRLRMAEVPAVAVAGDELEGEDCRPLQRSRRVEEAVEAEMVAGSAAAWLVVGVVEPDPEFFDDGDDEGLCNVEEVAAAGVAAGESAARVTKAFVCKYPGCGKEFTWQGNLAHHKKSAHEGVRYQCDVDGCGKSFTQQGSLDQHKKSAHEGVRYSCDECGKEFAWKIQITQHKKSAHEGVRYHCDVDGCGKSFTQKGYLFVHKQSAHEGVRNYCDVDGCGKSFTQKGHLTQHKRSVHGIVGGSATMSGAAQAGVSEGLRVLAEIAARKILTICATATFEEIVGQLHAEIETLQMQDNQQVTDEVLICVAGSCVVLKHFDIRGCAGITIDGLSAVLAACEGLETLLITVNDSLTAEVIDELKAAWPSLEILCAAQV